MTADRVPSDADLGARLVDLGVHLAFPSEPDLAPAVRRELLARRRPARPPWREMLGGRRVAAVASLALVLVAVVAVGVSPGARRALADLLGVAGIEIQIGGEAPAPGELGGELRLGRESTLSSAQLETTWVILKPAALGAPDEVRIADGPLSPRVTLLYRAREGLPRSNETGVGLMLTQFVAHVDQELVLKKVQPGATVRPVTLHGRPAYWIGRGPHIVFLLDAKGEAITESIRFADHTLVWQDGGVTLRIESALSLQETLRIARSVR